MGWKVNHYSEVKPDTFIYILFLRISLKTTYFFLVNDSIS